jgi:ABC-2 type transport system permease protein
MFRRELAVVLGARVTWLAAAAAALLVGHGFVLAVDLFTAGSRSALANDLMSREFDPLLGIVRPTLGGLYLATSLFGPLIGARAVAIEKDRRSFAGRLLASGSTIRFLGTKGLAALAGACLPWVCAIALLVVWRAVGGHLALAETTLALFGHLLYLAFVTSVGLAAGALARGFAQAATVGLLTIAFTWAIDAAEGFSALAWLGGAAAWSPSTHLRSLEQGTLNLGAAGWLIGATGGALAFAYVGCRFDWHGRYRAGALVAAFLVLVVAASGLSASRRAWDLTEGKRRSLPPAAVAELRGLPGHLRMVVNLDREDSRRRQLESDLLAKLRLARPDLEVRFPPDERATPAELERDDTYGRIVVSLGDRSKETTSISRRELTTLIFELAGQPLPDWSAPEYTGYPLVVEGGRRSLVLAASYAGFPLAFMVLGLVLTTGRRRPT